MTLTDFGEQAWDQFPLYSVPRKTSDCTYKVEGGNDDIPLNEGKYFSIHLSSFLPSRFSCQKRNFNPTNWGPWGCRNGTLLTHLTSARVGIFIVLIAVGTWIFNTCSGLGAPSIKSNIPPELILSRRAFLRALPYFSGATGPSSNMSDISKSISRNSTTRCLCCCSCCTIGHTKLLESLWDLGMSLWPPLTLLFMFSHYSWIWKTCNGVRVLDSTLT